MRKEVVASTKKTILYLAWGGLALFSFYNTGKILWRRYTVNNDKQYVVSGQFEDFKEEKFDDSVVADSNLGIGFVKKYSNLESFIKITTYKKVTKALEFCQTVGGTYNKNDDNCLKQEKDNRLYYFWNDGKNSVKIEFSNNNWTVVRIEEILSLLKKVSR